ncbi:hypothetical protein NE237_021591 [Protea cynaroides]|uniref:Zinc knuckle CX2CX4HX4C domain-containing protein n=1 Tax=Protea cynaroides TaxID=273540 RepID=A0A9Q0K3F1_9MAGN|nr:hypothetical protein NE237_021591 [Protea cynaroides]
MNIDGIVAGKRVFYLRVGYLWSLSTPLRDYFTLKRKFQDDRVILFRFEKLPIFFYYCGLLGHESERCDRFYADCKLHIQDHRCSDPVLRSQMPKNHFSADLRGTPPSKRLLENAQIFSISESSSLGTRITLAPSPESFLPPQGAAQGRNSGGGVARSGTEQTGCKNHRNKNLKSILVVIDGIHEAFNEKSSFNAIAMICSFLLENVVETHAGGGVKCLMKYCGGDAGEESSDTFGLEDLDADGDGSHSWWRWRRSSDGDGGGVKGINWAESLNSCKIGEKEGWG